MKWLNEKYPIWWIVRRDLLKWLTISPDITPLNFCEGCVKSKVYLPQLDSITELVNAGKGFCNFIISEI